MSGLPYFTDSLMQLQDLLAIADLTDPLCEDGAVEAFCYMNRTLKVSFNISFHLLTHPPSINQLKDKREG